MIIFLLGHSHVVANRHKKTGHAAGFRNSTRERTWQSYTCMFMMS